MLALRPWMLPAVLTRRSTIRLHEWVGSLPGVAYDFTAAGGMTQDRGGLTPVTAAAQSIGLAHDYARASAGWVSGTERVTNGSFAVDADWAKGTGWTISGGVANKTPGVQSNLSQTCLTLNRIFVVTGEVVGRTAGSLNVYFGSGFAFVSLSANGQFSVVGQCVGSTALILQGTTSFDGSIDNISVREITGNPLIAPTDARRPTWGAMANGLPCSVWDGTRATATAAAVDFSSTDQITVMAAVRKTSDAATATIAELSSGSGNGRWLLQAPGPSGGYYFGSFGTAFTATTAAGAADDSAIIVCTARISTPILTIRRNSGANQTSVGSQGTGNYGNHTLNIGARNAASPSLFFNGQIARLLAIGGNPTAEQYAAWLAWTAQGFATS